MSTSARGAKWLFGMILAMALVTVSPVAAAPVVAVFDIESRGAPVSEETLQTLSDLLRVRIAATGQYRVIPHAQIKERLARLKLESYKDCYDQSCQIELGRELAANKSLASRLSSLDGQCLLSLELYDLRSATTDFAHASRGGCSEGALFAAFSTGVKALAAWAAQPRDRPSRDLAERPKVTVWVRSSPSGAEVLIDGLARGKTPLDLTLERGKTYGLALHSDNYQRATRQFVADDGLSLDETMKLTPAGRLDLATTSEWFGFGSGPAFLHGSGLAVMAFTTRIGTIKWRRFFWTIFDLTMLIGDFGAASTTASGSAGVVDVGMRAGYPLYLGRRGQHQLLGGVGLLAQLGGNLASGSDSASYFSVSPGVDYVYNAFDGIVPFGIGVRACFPVARDFGGDPYPWQVFATANVGFSIYRFLVAVRRARASSTVPASVPEPPGPGTRG